jgi:CarD family transcriptional regulator
LFFQDVFSFFSAIIGIRKYECPHSLFSCFLQENDLRKALIPFIGVRWYLWWRPYFYSSIHLDQEDIVFIAGDMAVYPAHGVGVIESIETQTVAGTDHSFYVMKIIENDMKIMIPTMNSANVGLRAIIDINEVEKVMVILRNRDIEISAQTWNRRYRDYMEKIKTGSIFEVAVVLRDLFLLSVDKELSYGERKMMDTAKNLLVKEISLARNMDEANTADQIERMFS